ncbi:hypothetical protein M404DRAFT_991932 [Pisolithus tinctorius Marx 270]|uniref:Uncharacterized protein n=1 Tax=Pisolithus tinctorius Marx 270 TaxID=870435 RepID=A0A0C3PZC9_PISTI|nr:hypothetical protein M404DRAFT_991932 [Pisolithus tinctorius Marx 270]
MSIRVLACEHSAYTGTDVNRRRVCGVVTIDHDSMQVDPMLDDELCPTACRGDGSVARHSTYLSSCIA